MYEDVGHHQHTVKDAQDLAKCWAGLAVGGRGDDTTKHLEAVIVDYDETVAKSGSGKTVGRGRASLAERRQKALKSQGPTSAEVREPVESLDFRARHRWINDMMKLLGEFDDGESG